MNAHSQQLIQHMLMHMMQLLADAEAAEAARIAPAAEAWEAYQVAVGYTSVSCCSIENLL